MKKEASITVFAGGTGSEREVSLSTGMALTESLAKSFKTHMIDLTEEALPAVWTPPTPLCFLPFMELSEKTEPSISA